VAEANVPIVFSGCFVPIELCIDLSFLESIRYLVYSRSRECLIHISIISRTSGQNFIFKQETVCPLSTDRRN